MLIEHLEQWLILIYLIWELELVITIGGQLSFSIIFTPNNVIYLQLDNTYKYLIT